MWVVKISEEEVFLESIICVWYFIKQVMGSWQKRREMVCIVLPATSHNEIKQHTTSTNNHDDLIVLSAGEKSGFVVLIGAEELISL